MRGQYNRNNQTQRYGSQTHSMKYLAPERDVAQDAASGHGSPLPGSHYAPLSQSYSGAKHRLNTSSGSYASRRFKQ